jgi:hypothetical protein
MVLISVLVINSKKAFISSKRFLGVVLLLILPQLGWSTTAEQAAQQQFLQQTFGSTLPAVQRLWLTPDMQTKITQLVGAPYQQTVIRYWQDPQEATRLLFILEAIGKEDWITAGFVVQQLAMQNTQVLVYRETRGGEIQSIGFLQQFRQLQMRDQQLSRHIDGITGATLSVRAMTKMSKLALYFAEQIHASR